ncbi:MAG: methyltransferase domain-containing protein [Proteobacteria bacterium]|nr:methyltransferase domain-containing protein [Pseudomonadota bacterium]MBU1686125.1 methyltransferase domain-containing protein [Pseudomonadota bacterium]
MSGTNFSEIASRYEQDSIIQRSAAEKLIALLDIGRYDRVLDLGCGTGNLTRRLRTLTNGMVCGVDPSASMIREAQAQSGDGTEYLQMAVEDLDFGDPFTVIFCNSVFQWFRDPAKALTNCFRALQPGGRMGIQAPAKSIYCPNFVTAMEAVAHDPRTALVFRGFTLPWLFLESAGAYADLFRQAGFTVPFAILEEQVTTHSSAEVMTIFESGAAAGYLNQKYYQAPLAEDYVISFRKIVQQSFRDQAADGGMVSLVFNRIYLVAEKEQS